MKSDFSWAWILLLIFPALSFAKTQKVDSLRQILETELADTTKLRVLVELSAAMGARDEEQIDYLRRAEVLAKKLEDYAAQSKMLSKMGWFYHSRHEYRQALQYIRSAEQLAELHQIEEQIPRIHVDLGHAYRRLSKLDSAILVYQEALRGFEVLGDQFEPWKAYFGMAHAYAMLKDYDRSEQNLLSAHEIVKDSDDRIAKGSVIHALADVYKNSGNFDGFYDMQQAWEDFQKEKRRDLSYMKEKGHLSLVATFARMDKDLINKFENAVEYFKENGNAFRLGWSYFDLGNAYFLHEDYEKALSNFKLALVQYRLSGYKNRISETYQKLYESEKHLNRPEQALSYLEKQQALQDSLNQETMKAHIAELEVSFNTEQKEQRLAMQELEIKQKTMERNIFMSSSGLIALLALSIFFGFRNRIRLNQKIARQEADLQEQKIKQLEQEKNLTAYNAMLEGQEKERIRIAKDLHDSLGGLLTTVKAHFNALKPLDLKPQSGEIYSKTNKLIDDASVEVRRISHNMVPKALAIYGLRGALEDLVENLEAHGVEAKLEMINLEEELSTSKSLVLFRTIQEITNNILKHAFAEHVLIQLIRNGNQLNVFVEDDGKGFDLQKALENGGMGLQNIVSRVQFLNGEIEWDSVPKEGTTISFRFPLEEVRQNIHAA